MQYEKRGMFFEDVINRTIDFYKIHDIAILHKTNLNISFSDIKNIAGKKIVSNGYIKTKSTTDYYGVYKGRFITFEAKSTNLKSLPLKNIKQHQLDYLWKVYHHQGIAFLLIYFSKYDKIFIIYIHLLKFLPKIKKSIPLDFAMKYGIEINIVYPGIIDFISFLEL